jgi:hypothetical protein
MSATAVVSVREIALPTTSSAPRPHTIALSAVPEPDPRCRALPVVGSSSRGAPRPAGTGWQLRALLGRPGAAASRTRLWRARAIAACHFRERRLERADVSTERRAMTTTVTEHPGYEALAHRQPPTESSTTIVTRGDAPRPRTPSDVRRHQAGHCGVYVQPGLVRNHPTPGPTTSSGRSTFEPGQSRTIRAGGSNIPPLLTTRMTRSARSWWVPGEMHRGVKSKSTATRRNPRTRGRDAERPHTETPLTSTT